MVDSDRTTGSTSAEPRRGDDRLDSWKRVANYLNRSVRTVRRWEAEEGLPIHRHPHKRLGSIFAYESEIEAWLGNRSEQSGIERNTKRRPMLAVLPFENLSGDPGQEYFSDGLTEEMISQLGQVRHADLGVIARTSIMVYKGAKKTIREIGDELGVHYILEGSVRRQQTRVRITAQLVRVSDQTHIWARNYERSLTDILELQRTISVDITVEIRHRLIKNTPAVRQQESYQSRSVKQAAYDTYLKGRYQLYRLTPESIKHSIDSFDYVIGVDPQFAAAYAGKAEALLLMTLFAPVPPNSTMPQGLEAAKRAVSIDPDSAEAFAALGFMHSSYTWDWRQAEHAYLRAIELNPSLVAGYQWYAEFLSEMSRFDEALDLIDKARRLDPLSLAVATSRGHVLWLARRPEELITEMLDVIEMEPRFPLAHLLLIMGYWLLERYDDSVDASVNAIEACGPQNNFEVLLGYSAARAGQHELAKKQVERVTQIANDQFVSRYLFAMLSMGQNQHEKAMSHLESAFEERTWHMTTIDTFFLFDPIRNETRFQNLLKKVGFRSAD